MSTACHEIEVFTKVLQTTINKLLEGGEDAVIKHLPEFSVCKPLKPFIIKMIILFISG